MFDGIVVCSADEAEVYDFTFPDGLGLCGLLRIRNGATRWAYFVAFDFYEALLFYFGNCRFHKMSQVSRAVCSQTTDDR